MDKPAWETLDADGHFYGVFDAEGCSPVPLLIVHGSEADAAEEAAMFCVGDFTIMRVHHLAGVVWNSIEPEPESAPTVAEVDDRRRKEPTP